MTKTQICDFCGRTIQIAENPALEPPPIELDADGLWACSDCKLKITSSPVEIREQSNLDERLQPLIGKSAGAICRTLELPYEPPYQTIIDAASNIAYDQDVMMSAWLFVTQWLDGTTVWRKSNGSAKALVTEDGNITIHQR